MSFTISMTRRNVRVLTTPLLRALKACLKGVGVFRGWATAPKTGNTNIMDVSIASWVLATSATRRSDRSLWENSRDLRIIPLKFSFSALSVVENECSRGNNQPPGSASSSAVVALGPAFDCISNTCDVVDLLAWPLSVVAFHSHHDTLCALGWSVSELADTRCAGEASALSRPTKCLRDLSAPRIFVRHGG